MQMRLLATFALAALACQPAMAQAMQPSCLSAKQAASLAGYALPSVITGTTKRCATALDGTSYLKANGDALASRYAQRKDANWPEAKAAFLQMSRGKDDASNVLGQLPDESLRPMLDVILEGMVAQEIPLTDCGKIDSFVRLLAPLPPENTAELIALAMGLVGKSDKARPGKMAIC
jgi:hypothetical protein